MISHTALTGFTVPIRWTSITISKSAISIFAKDLVAQDAGVGDQDVDAAPGVHGVLDHLGDAGVVGHRRAVGDGFAAERLDLLDDLLGRIG